ncbi:MAG TPA: GntR family transcriptional regulator [Ramlibacter sp.]|jgi:DNA-binding GntR family transcriptional regulator|nr:GntR family transcriptional regulator [Ramlibacter sp.]
MSLAPALPSHILQLVRTEELAVGAHLPAQWLADRLRVSRSPVNEALELLQAQGIVRREPNRGYFLAASAPVAEEATVSPVGAEQDLVARAYHRIAEDRLRGELPDQFTEAMLRRRYQLTPAQLQAVLARIGDEGWARKKPGYGWEFSTMLTTPESLLQSYRLRYAIEPAALLEPGYRLDKQVIARCRAAEMHLLNGGIDTDTPDQLHDRGVRFHESLIEGSGNPFFIDTMRRVNRVRRLLSYRSMRDRSRYQEHCDQHLMLLDLLERERNEEAAAVMREHLGSTLRNLARISNILEQPEEK